MPPNQPSVMSASARSTLGRDRRAVAIIASVPPACTHGGRYWVSDDDEASYGYTSKKMSMPSARARVEHRQQLVAGAPALRAVDREVAELDRHAGAAPDVDRLRHRRPLVGRDRPRVRGVEGAPRREHPGERGDLVEVAVRAGHVGEPGAHAERALLERVVEVAFHALQLVGGRRSLVDAHRRHPQRAVPGERGDVDA